MREKLSYTWKNLTCHWENDPIVIWFHLLSMTFIFLVTLSILLTLGKELQKYHMQLGIIIVLLFSVVSFFATISTIKSLVKVKKNKNNKSTPV